MEKMENEVLSDDELYAKIETEKLLKRKKVKKIATLSSLCVAMVLAVVVIIMAAVPVSLKPKCINGGFADVSLYSGSSSPAVYSSGEEGYNKFLKYYNKAFSQTYLTGLFSGSLSSYKIDESYTKVEDSLATVKNLAGNNNIVRLRFNKEKTFTNQNGKVYKSKYRNTLWNGTLTFTEAYVVVNSTSGMQDTNIYVIVNYPVFKGGQQTDTDKCLITVTVKADTSVIYNSWSNLT